MAKIHKCCCNNGIKTAMARMLLDEALIILYWPSLAISRLAISARQLMGRLETKLGSVLCPSIKSVDTSQTQQPKAGMCSPPHSISTLLPRTAPIGKTQTKRHLALTLLSTRSRTSRKSRGRIVRRGSERSTMDFAGLPTVRMINFRRTCT